MRSGNYPSNFANIRPFPFSPEISFYCRYNNDSAPQNRTKHRRFRINCLCLPPDYPEYVNRIKAGPKRFGLPNRCLTPSSYSTQDTDPNHIKLQKTTYSLYGCFFIEYIMCPVSFQPYRILNEIETDPFFIPNIDGYIFFRKYADYLLFSNSSNTRL